MTGRKPGRPETPGPPRPERHRPHRGSMPGDIWIVRVAPGGRAYWFYNHGAAHAALDQLGLGASMFRARKG